MIASVVIPIAMDQEVVTTATRESSICLAVAHQNPTGKISVGFF